MTTVLSPWVAAFVRGAAVAMVATAAAVGGASAQPAAPAATAEVAPGPLRNSAIPADPALEARVLKLSAELRCLVCQNQTIADSNADLALDLRRQVREMLQQGRSDREVLDFMTARYGDFVLYRPPVRSDTALLWFGPAALMLLGLGVLVFVLRRRAALPDDQFEPDADPDEDLQGSVALRAAGAGGPPLPPAPDALRATDPR
jgi:cytochrome c-type biogenesis protein CcmH